jgi:S1-C subfamily serine protease
MAQPSNGRGRSGLGILLVLLLVALGGGGAAGGATVWWLTGEPEATASGQVPVTAVPLNQLSLSPLVDRTAAAVVNIAVLQAAPMEQNPLLRDPYYRYFFGGEAEQPRVSAGSGVIVDAAKGLILTNNHVVENASAIEITLSDRRRLEARLLGTDPGTDIALLQVSARGLKQLSLGDSNGLKVGDYVVAIGNPFQIGQTVTAGIVSALGRGRRDAGPTYVQTDAPINPGNSGGPLISMRGEVIGINSAIVGPGEGNVGIGLAVPSNTARKVMEAILKARAERGLS